MCTGWVCVCRTRATNTTGMQPTRRNSLLNIQCYIPPPSPSPQWDIGRRRRNIRGNNNNDDCAIQKMKKRKTAKLWNDARPRAQRIIIFHFRKSHHDFLEAGHVWQEQRNHVSHTRNFGASEKTVDTTYTRCVPFRIQAHAKTMSSPTTYYNIS